MPVCVKCREMFPPDFVSELDDNDMQCEWCKQGKKSLKYTEKDGSTRNYTKEDCVKDYKIFLGMLKDTKDVKKVFEKEKERS